MNSDDYEFRYDLGISQPADKIRLSDKQTIVELMTKHFTILRVKAELDQILCGLSSTLNFLEFVRNNQRELRQFFIYNPPPTFTWSSLYNLLPATMSEIGTNRREEEENVIMKWINLTRIVEGVLYMKVCDYVTL